MEKALIIIPHYKWGGLSDALNLNIAHALCPNNTNVVYIMFLLRKNKQTNKLLVTHMLVWGFLTDEVNTWPELLDPATGIFICQKTHSATFKSRSMNKWVNQSRHTQKCKPVPRADPRGCVCPLDGCGGPWAAAHPAVARPQGRTATCPQPDGGSRTH